MARTLPGWLVVVGVALASCGEPAPRAPEAATRRDGIRGGSADAGSAYGQVFMVRMRFDNGSQFACSATHITPRSLLLAAHCFDPEGAGATAMVGAWATNATPAPPSTSPAWIPLVATRAHPAWTRASPSLNDLALALLADDAGVPLPAQTSPYLQRALTSADVGAPLEVVGYGLTAADGADQGTRREVDLPLDSLTAEHLNVGDHAAAGLCNGDSGGPSFLRGRDGVLRVAGVHSYDSSRECTFGQDTRVDLFGPFIRQWVTDVEGATCLEDGLCRPGCAPVDVDCVCQADGVCNAGCPTLLSDPDCPAECAAKGSCAPTLLPAAGQAPLGTAAGCDAAPGSGLGAAALVLALRRVRALAARARPLGGSGR